MQTPAIRRRFSIPCQLAMLFSLSASACITVNLGTSGPGEMAEAVIEGDSGPKVLLLDIDGEITSADAAGVFGLVTSEGTVSRIHDQLALATANDDIAAVLLRIDSPGGSPSASDSVYQQIVDFKTQTGVPVLAQFLGTGASGGYLIAMAADEVVATRTTITGSIGVIMLGINLSNLMDKFGVENQTFTSGTFKDAGSMLRPMTADEHAQLQSVLDDLYEQFVLVVDEGRPNLSIERVRELADGRIYSAQQALEVGLVDRIDTLDGSIDKLRVKLGAESVRVVSYSREQKASQNVYSRAALPTSVDLSSDPLQKAWPRAGFYYLWWPGVHDR